MKIVYFFLLFIMIISNSTYAIDSTLKRKYPFIVLTDDHGILREEDLFLFAKTLKYEKFTEKSLGLIYWQCFPTKQISITLRDMGYTTEEFGPNDPLADLTIFVHAKPEILHIYSMRRAYPLSVYQEDFIRWKKILKGEKYVCIAGSFIKNEENKKNGTSIQTNSWIFDMLKTKKGSSSFFHH